MDDEVYVKEQLSSRKIMELLEKNPDLKKIKCPSSLYLRTSKKYLEVLSKLGIEVEPVASKGRPKKYENSEVRNIQKMLDQGSTPREISEKLHIPLKTVYYLKKSELKRGRKRKYKKETEMEVKNLYKNGLRAKEISKKLDIPLRTVYSLIER